MARHQYKNKAKCKNCGDTIESKSVHDFVACSCFSKDNGHGFFLDGGNDYHRFGGNFNDIEWVEEPLEK